MADLQGLVRAVTAQATPSNRMVGRWAGIADRRTSLTGSRLANMPLAPTSLTHWGAFSAGIESGDIASVTPLDGDTDPSPLLGNLPGAIRHSARITTPAVRRGWLRDGPGPSTRRGADEFVAVSFKELTELLAGELRRVADTHGNEAIYGGSSGGAGAGRVHPAP